MAFAFDTLSFARHLREHGIPQEQAEAHAEAVRTFVMVELVTKQDLASAMETQTLRLTVRLGIMNAALMTLLVALFGLMLKLR